MWFYFIDTFFELLKSHPEKYEYINKFLSKLMARSDVQDILKENHYLCWVRVFAFVNCSAMNPTLIVFFVFVVDRKFRRVPPTGKINQFHR